LFGQKRWLLQLGDTRERAFELFPRKPNMDQEWQEGGGCGTTINWLDKKRQTVVGMFSFESEMEEPSN